jgi:hypothetical protein
VCARGDSATLAGDQPGSCPLARGYGRAFCAHGGRAMQKTIGIVWLLLLSAFCLSAILYHDSHEPGRLLSVLSQFSSEPVREEPKGRWQILRPEIIDWGGGLKPGQAPCL